MPAPEGKTFMTLWAEREKQRHGDSRDKVLGNLRRALRRNGADDTAAAAVRERLAEHRPNTIPVRAVALDQDGQTELFRPWPKRSPPPWRAFPGSTRCRRRSPITWRSTICLRALVLTPDPQLAAIPWEERPTARPARGHRRGTAIWSALTGAFAAIAETGTLMLISGPDIARRATISCPTLISSCCARSRSCRPTRKAGTACALKTLTDGKFAMPRTVNFITGPSRTATSS